MSRQRLHLEHETCPACGLEVLAAELDATMRHEWARMKLAPVLIAPPVQAQARAAGIRLFTIHEDKHRRRVAGLHQPDADLLEFARTMRGLAQHGEFIGVAPWHVHRHDPPGVRLEQHDPARVRAPVLAALDTAIARYPDHAELLRTIYDPAPF